MPGPEIASFSQSNATLTNLTVTPTGSFWETLPILEYTAGHNAVPVSAGQCYWIEITNDVGGDGPQVNPSSWSWQMSLIDPTTPPFYQGNGRLAADGFAEGSAVNGFTIEDLVGGGDLAFSLNLGLAVPSCGLDTLYNTGPETVVLWDPWGFSDTTFLGWYSGQLCSPDCPTDNFPQRRTAQAFTLPDTPDAEQSWRIRQIFADGYSPYGADFNEELSFEIFARSGLVRPVSEDSLITGSVPFQSTETGLAHPQDVPGGVGAYWAVHAMHVDFSLPPGDYWLTVWASNDDPYVSTNFAWFTNPPDGINVFCAPVDCIPPTPEDHTQGEIVACDPDNCDPSQVIMWRSRHWPPLPDGFGFGSYSLSVNMLIPHPDADPDPDPDDLYNTAFMIRGNPGATCGNGVIEPGETCDPPSLGCTAICQYASDTCPWDCADGDGEIGLAEFLAILGTWTHVGVPCDFDGDGVGITDFLEILGRWGPCP